LCPDLRDKIEATVTGYSEINKLEPELFTHSNSIHSINDNALFYDIDASASQRGSPVYIVEEGQIKAVGIHKAFSSNKNLSYATMINE
jgi:V8-like Glu-specific endopeptidase